MQDETDDQELERRRLVERVQKDLQHRYAWVGSVVLACAGGVITIIVHQFTADARQEFKKAHKMYEQTQKSFVDAEIKTNEMSTKMTDVETRLIEASGDLDDLRQSLLVIVDEIARENIEVLYDVRKDLYTLRADVDEIRNKLEGRFR